MIAADTYQNAETHDEKAEGYGNAVGTLGTLKEQVARACAAINQIAGKVSPSLAKISPTSAFSPNATPLAEAVKPFPHLLILQPLQTNAQPFYFNLHTAVFDELRRQTNSAGLRKSASVDGQSNKP